MFGHHANLRALLVRAVCITELLPPSKASAAAPAAVARTVTAAVGVSCTGSIWAVVLHIDSMDGFLLQQMNNVLVLLESIACLTHPRDLGQEHRAVILAQLQLHVSRRIKARSQPRTMLSLLLHLCVVGVTVRN